MRKACVFYVTVGLFVAFARLAQSDEQSGKNIRYVVSPSTDSEDFYVELNRRAGANSVYSNLERSEICNAIFKSQSIPPHNDVDIIDDPIAQNIHPWLFRTKHDWHLFGRPSYELLVNVSVLQTTAEEAVFPCRVKVKETGELKLYLVSGLYDFNRGIPSLTYNHPAHGRFVFEYNESSNLARLIAIAETPARVFAWNKNREYLKNYSVAISERSRAICDFTTGRKLRICSVGLNASPPGSTLLPMGDRIEPRCENITVRLDGSLAATGIWGIRCKAERRSGEELLQVYDVSLGSEPHQFFISDDESFAIYQFYSHLAVDDSV